MNAPRNPSGLEVLQQVADGRLDPPAMAVTMGMTMGEIEEGHVVFKAIADERHVNPQGGTHGGFAATILDSVTGCAVHSMLPGRVGYGTIELNVKMLKRIPPGVEMTAVGKVISMSKRLGVAEGTITDENGELYAHGTATCMIMR